MIQQSIAQLMEGKSLSTSEAEAVMAEIMTGQATSAQTASFLTALRLKGESAEELYAFASVMRMHCRQIHPKVAGRLVDTCGTGGDKLKTFNVSTAAAFVIAGAGVAVAKHGNRSVTSCSGSADVLEQLGFNLSQSPETIEAAIEEVGVGFMFAPAFHPAMKHVAPVRREIGIRTVFNMLGPLTNPANASSQLLGVYDSKLAVPLASALGKLGCQEAMVVHGLDGLDEISTVGKTAVAHLKDGQVTETTLSPRDLGVKKAEVASLQCHSAIESARVTLKIIAGEDLGTAKADIVLVNAAAGIMVGGKAASFGEGRELAQKSIKSGAAYSKLRRLVELSGGDLQKLEEYEQQ
ncbi:MAG: anthranilate phosphoribosyltransferase [Candidatus Bathyarchaeota archaeon]|nr:anthranilate phosphoribosyltransferase [Candidatus Bathyarchaeota archaeon]